MFLDFVLGVTFVLSHRITVILVSKLSIMLVGTWGPSPSAGG